MAWLRYTRGQIKPFVIDPNMWGIYEFGGLKQDSLITKCVYFNFGPKVWFYWDRDETEAYGKKMIEFLRNNDNFKEHFEYFSKIATRVQEKAEEIRRIDLKNVSDYELFNLLDSLGKSSREGLGMLAIDIDAMDYYFEDFLQKEIKKELGDKIQEEKFLDIYNLITKTTYLSFIGQQEKEIIKLAIAKINGENIDSQVIENLKNDFWWTKIGWENIIPHENDFFEKEIEKYSQKEIKELKSKLQEVSNYSEKTKKERASILEKYNLSSHIEYWLEVLDEYTKFHDVRKESQVRVLFSSELLLDEIAKRNGKEKDDLEWLFHEEVKEFFEKESFFEQEIEKRKRAVSLILGKNKCDVLSGDEAEDFFNKNLKEKSENVTEFKGMGVSGGVVRGKVKVCAGGKESQEKIENGDILVTGMTLPDYVPAMKKSAAIITDEGGITCHAAIISRELGIPCVVGTKIATQVLKDGDEVEVDAEKGIIKIIK